MVLTLTWEKPGDVYHLSIFWVFLSLTYIWLLENVQTKSKNSTGYRCDFMLSCCCPAAILLYFPYYFMRQSLIEGSQQRPTLSAFQMTLCRVTLEEAEPSDTVTDYRKEFSVMDLHQDLSRHIVHGRWYRNPIPRQTDPDTHKNMYNTHTHTHTYTWIHTLRMTESQTHCLSSLSSFAFSSLTVRERERLNNLSVCIYTHVHTCGLTCVFVLHQVVTSAPTFRNTTVSFTIKALSCLFDLFGYWRIPLHKTLLVFFLFSLFEEASSNREEERITTSQGFCCCVFMEKNNKKMEVKVKKKTWGEGFTWSAESCYLQWGGEEQPQG